MREFKFRIFTNEEFHYLSWDDIISTPYTLQAMRGEPVSQYTGLKDVRGKEIYEGDIIRGGRCDRRVLQIKYEELYNCGCCEKDDGIGFNFRGLDPSECEVIGNIYENPDLLENSK